MFRISLLLLLCIVSTVYTQKYAIISTLTSDSFFLTAKVLAHRLKTLNDTIPYIIEVTQDVSNSSIEILRERGVRVIQTCKIDTPYLPTHKARKFQYTKIRLWNLTEYDTLIHLDLDILPMKDISELFRCGTFCATFRHSDKFNSGVFVMKPNREVYYDMLNKSQTFESYDGGDQGFLNSYYNQLKFAPMFDPSKKEQTFNSDIRRFSSAYNYDIGMYYLYGGRLLIEPIIIHFTMGPTKPWLWWTYPVFNLNQHWLQARFEMEEAYGESNPDIYLIPKQICIIIILLIVRKLALYIIPSRFDLRTDELSSKETRLIAFLSTVTAITVSFNLIPLETHPIPSWIFFTINTVLVLLLICDIYSSIRFSRTFDLSRLSLSAFLLIIMISLSWTSLSLISSFSTRALAVLTIVPLNILSTVVIVQRLLLTPYQYQCTRYQLLTKSVIQ